MAHQRRDESQKVVQISSVSRRPSMLKCPLKTPGKATSSKPFTSSTGPSGVEIHARILQRLRRLDAEQLQLVDFVAAAIERGALTVLVTLTLFG